MALPFLGPLISGASSLLGGFLNRRDTRKANAANSPVGQVAQWEAAGINPEFGISSGGYIPQQASTIGDSFATAGAIFGDALERDHAAKLKETEVKKENVELRKKLDDLANPRSAGWLKRYGSIMPLPSEYELSAPRRREAKQAIAPLTGRDDAPYLEAAETAPVENVPLLWKYRTGINGSKTWAGLNPDAWEVGVGELAGGAIVHGTGYVLGEIDKARTDKATRDKAIADKKPKRYPMKAVEPLRGYYGPAGSRSGF